MTNSKDILTHFGGVQINSLKHMLFEEDDVETNDDELDIMKHSLYYDDDNLILKFKQNKKQFSVLSMNIGSLNSKFDLFKIYVEYLKQNSCVFNVICLQESWLSKTSDLSLYQLDDYNLISEGKVCSAHGGLAIYVMKDFKYTLLTHLYTVSDVWEGQFIELSGSNINRKIIIGNIYRPPRDIEQNYRTFINELNPIMELLNGKNCEVLLSGDYNINLLKINEKKIFNEFLDTVISNGFIPKITFPTRFSRYRGTLIDNIYSKLTPKTMNAVAGILTHTLSDHHPYFIIMNSLIKQQEKNKFVKMRKKDNSSLLNWLSERQICIAKWTRTFLRTQTKIITLLIIQSNRPIINIYPPNL